MKTLKERERERKRLERKRKRSEGECLNCTKKAESNKVHCTKHLLYFSDLRAEFKYANLCQRCGRKRDREGVLCQKCNTHANQYQNFVRKQRRELGLCVLCKIPSEKYYCPECTKQRAIEQVKYRERKNDLPYRKRCEEK